MDTPVSATHRAVLALLGSSTDSFFFFFFLSAATRHDGAVGKHKGLAMCFGTGANLAGSTLHLVLDLIPLTGQAAPWEAELYSALRKKSQFTTTVPKAPGWDLEADSLVELLKCLYALQPALLCSGRHTPSQSRVWNPKSKTGTLRLLCHYCTGCI